MTGEVDRRLAFDAAAESYDLARPEYPSQIFDDLFAYLGMAAAPRVCEIGPGTGQATGGLLARGALVTAVEIGPNLASALRSKFAGEPRLSVVLGAFEEVALPQAAFDLVVAATSWHWLAAETRVAKAVSLLRPSGVLATLATVQVSEPEDRGFFQRGHAVYERHGRRERFTPGPRAAEVAPAEAVEFMASALLRDVQVRTYRWDQRYSAGQYEHLLRSYSDIQAMPPSERESLIADLKALIAAEFDGYVVRPLVIALTMARRS